MLKYFFHRKYSEREGLALVLIAKNEASYIKEWLDFHIKQGVSHFIIYDNESTDNFREVLNPYIESGVVDYVFISGRMRQDDVYNMAVNKYRSKFKYMGFIDADEFVFVRNTPVDSSLYRFVDDFMTSHKNAGGIGINWLIFGSNGHTTKPEGGVLENYTMRAEDDFFPNRHIKTICDPTRVISVSTHYPTYVRGFHNLDENGERIDGPTTRAVHFSKIRINHYFTKSREEFMLKRNRGMADNNGIRNVSEFEAYDQKDILDTEILSHI